MALVSLRQLLDHAAENGYGLPAFNVNNLEQIQAIMEAADETNSPVIMQGSAGARKYAGEPFLRHLIEAAVEAYPHIPVVMHQDHGASPGGLHPGDPLRLLQRDDGRLADEDGKTPSSFEYNVDVTRNVVEMSHAVGVSVEGELGCLGSLETGHGEKEDGHGAEGVLTHDQLLTDPNEAAEFVKATRWMRWPSPSAPRHGAYKFTRPPTGEVLRIDRIKEIHARIPNTHLVMHGSSSRAAGMARRSSTSSAATWAQTYGVPVEEIVEGIKHGVRKVNIDTDLRMASTGAIRRYLARKPQGLRPAQVPRRRDQGDEGNLQGALRSLRLRRPGGKIKPISLEAMATATPRAN